MDRSPLSLRRRRLAEREAPARWPSERPAAIVTGASSNIGRAIAERLSAEGVDLLAVDAEPDPTVPGHPFAADLGTREGNCAAVDAALARYGRLDAIVPSASFGGAGPIGVPPDGWDALLAHALAGPLLLARCAWPALVASPRARVIVIAAAHALVAPGYEAGRARARRGLTGLVETLARDGAPDGIMVSAICPACVRTMPVAVRVPGWSDAHASSRGRALEEILLAPHVVERLVAPAEVAEAVAFLMGPSGRSYTAMPVMIDLSWRAR